MTNLTTLADRVEAGTVEMHGEAVAEALRLAERRLDRQGWKYKPVDIGSTAREILSGLYPRARATKDHPHE